MNTITIELVRTIDGRLVGRTASCRWNLAVLLGDNHRLYPDRNGTAAKQLRRRFGPAFRFVQVRGVGQVRHAPSTREVQALGTALRSVVPAEHAALFS